MAEVAVEEVIRVVEEVVEVVLVASVLVVSRRATGHPAFGVSTKISPAN